MKDDSIWIVVEVGRTLNSGIRCEGGKEESKEVRKKKQTETKKEWKNRKITEKELARIGSTTVQD